METAVRFKFRLAVNQAQGFRGVIQVSIPAFVRKLVTQGDLGPIFVIVKREWQADFVDGCLHVHFNLIDWQKTSQSCNGKNDCWSCYSRYGVRLKRKIIDGRRRTRSCDSLRPTSVRLGRR